MPTDAFSRMPWTTQTDDERDKERLADPPSTHPRTIIDAYCIYYTDSLSLYLYLYIYIYIYIHIHTQSNAHAHLEVPPCCPPSSRSYIFSLCVARTRLQRFLDIAGSRTHLIDFSAQPGSRSLVPTPALIRALEGSGTE